MYNEIVLKPIGIIYTKFKELENMPIQPSSAKASRGTIELNYGYVEGLRDLEEFSHIIVIYHFHRAEQVKLTVKPFLDNTVHGVFATRTPVRPNHIGISVVEIESINNNTIIVKNIDVLDGTPVLDIKPFVPGFDIPKTDIKIGWLTENIKDVSTRLSDDRFI